MTKKISTPQKKNDEDQENTIRAINNLARRLPWIAVIGSLIAMTLILLEVILFH